MKRMYVNNKNKLSYKDRLAILKRMLAGWPVSKTAKRFGVNRRTIYHIRDRFERHGLHGLEDHRPGPRRRVMNSTFFDMVMEKRLDLKWGACRIEQFFKKQGFSVSHNKIHQIIMVVDDTNRRLGKRERPKYVQYQADNINDQWHIDWAVDPLTKKKLLAILDDRSRYVVYAGLFDEATDENSALGLRKAIATYGAPKELVSDNGSHFKNIHRKCPSAAVKAVEDEFGIKHIFIRAGHPQSNGKIERLFGSYKREIAIMNYAPVYDCLTWMHFYNMERIHQSLDYETPAHVFLGVK